MADASCASGTPTESAKPRFSKGLSFFLKSDERKSTAMPPDSESAPPKPNEPVAQIRVDTDQPAETSPKKSRPKSASHFGSFTGKFEADLWGKTDATALQQNLDALPREQLLKLASSMGKELGALYKAVAILNKLAVELDVYKATENVRSFVLELLSCERVTLFLLDHETKTLRARVKGENGDWTIIQTAVGEGIAGKVAETGTSMNISDAYACSIFNPAIDKATNFVTKSLLCCPIADLSGKHVAVIQAVNKVGGSIFRAADEANLELFGVHLGNTLTKSRLYASIMFEKQRLEKLHEGIRNINNPSFTLDYLVTAIDRGAYTVLHSEQTMLFLVDSARNQLWSRWQPYSAAEGSRLMHCATATMDSGVIGKACHKRAAESVRDSTVEALGLSKEILPFERVKCCLVQPILDMRGDRILAVMCCFNKRVSGDVGHSSLFSEPKYTINDMNAMALFSLEVARVLTERSLEISFANALSTVSSSANVDEAVVDLEAAVQAQLMTYAGLEEIESAAGSVKLADAALPPDVKRNSSLKAHSPAPGKDVKHQRSLSECLEEKAALVPLRNTLKLKSERLRKWDLDIHYSSKEDLMVVVFDIFVDAGVLEYFKIEERLFMIWITKVASHYRDNPYHNFQHVVHVLHAVFMILMTTEANQSVTRVDQIALLIAALCHDIGHDGKTNGFHIATSSEMARCYNDISVLENHHCALTYDLINKCQLLSHLEKPVQLEIRKIVVTAILATDMSGHFSLTTDFKNHDKFSVDSAENRMLLCKTILHAADLSNPTLPFAVTSYISQNVHREFKMQVQAEMELGITPLPHMNAKDERVQCLLEISFIDVVVTPLWEHLAMLFPALAPCIAQVHVNRSNFQCLAQRRTHSIKEELQAAHIRS